MPSGERIYRRTQAGTDAHVSGDTAVPADYRRMLALLEADTHFDVIRGCLRQYPDKLLLEWLAELEEIGLIEYVEADDPSDLDFTAFFASKQPKGSTLLPEDTQGLEKAALAAGRLLARTGASVSEARLKNRPAWPMPASKTVVLIVEDDPDQLALADLRVSMAGYIVRVARSARELVEGLRQDARVDILLLDVMLPDGNGFEILAKMRRHPKLTLLPIVMLTAKDEAADMKKGMALGADAYVTKPYSKNILVDTIRKVLKQPAPA